MQKIGLKVIATRLQNVIGEIIYFSQNKYCLGASQGKGPGNEGDSHGKQCK